MEINLALIIDGSADFSLLLIFNFISRWINSEEKN